MIRGGAFHGRRGRPPSRPAVRAGGTNTAYWIAERSFGKGVEDDDPELYLQAAERYVEEMFAGPKAGLRPLYNELLRVGLAKKDRITHRIPISSLEHIDAEVNGRLKKAYEMDQP